MQNTAAFLKVIIGYILIMPFSVVLFAYADQSVITQPQWQLSSSLGDAPKYGADFKHYAYVNPNARKGGALNIISTGTFDNLNPFIPEGVSDTQIGIIYDTLMARSTEEQSVNYPLIATALKYPNDYSWVKYNINDKAYFHDGTPITPEDVVWSFNKLKEVSPIYSSYYSAVKSAEVTGKDEVTFTFARSGNRELPNIIGQLLILPKHWWQAKGLDGKPRDISKPLREIPLGSGPYKLESYLPGKSTVYKRVDDYWGKNLPVNVGRYNFDSIRNTYYLNENASWEAFKKGGVGDFRQETRIQAWMQNYNFPAVKNGLVKRESFYFHSIGRMQGYFLNLRRAKFADLRVRKALTLAFDFEHINRALYFNQYERINSYFYGLNFVDAQTLPAGKELQLLQSVHDEVPKEVFEKPFTLPVYKSDTPLRDKMAQAMQLLHEAGWRLEKNQLVNAKGEPFTMEFLLNSAAFERPTGLYIANLKRLGIAATMRTIDQAQYQNRSDNYDFDAISSIVVQLDSPGNEQLYYFGSSVANKVGGKNYGGIQNPAIDKMIDAISYAHNREDLIAAVRAMDRILLWNYYVVPQWSSPKINIAYWDKFDIPRPQPDAMGIDIYSWAINPQKQQVLEKK